jgi:amidohydrolase
MLPALLTSLLLTDVTAYLPVVKDAYAYLHANPELGKAEVKTHAYLDKRLRELGYTQFVTSAAAPTAVIAVLDSKRPGPVIALRAEMDARPLEGGGTMHSCGHDVHAAVLLGAAAMLIKEASTLRGKIVFVFQPAEETPGGADDLVNEQVLTKLGVTSILAEHVASGMPVGTIAVSPGPALASSSYFTLTLLGVGAHAAAPSQGQDVLLAAAKIAEELSTFPARHRDVVTQPTVISITKLVADSESANTLPAIATLKGTVRAFDNPHAGLEPELHALVDALSKAYGVTPRWDFVVKAPVTVSTPALYNRVVPALSKSFSGTVDTSPRRVMYSEDFGYYAPTFETLYVSLGIAKDGLGLVDMHQPSFTVHPDALAYGLEAMHALARAALAAP